MLTTATSHLKYLRRLFYTVAVIVPFTALPGQTAEVVTCLKAINDMQTLGTSDLVKLLDKDPEEALSSMTDEQRAGLKAYITAKEAKTFRCARFTPPPRPNPKR